VNHGPAIISSHDPRWAERAAALIATLQRSLGARAPRIDHIGSTAIPTMDAKDVLDIQVSVTDLDDAQEHFQAPLDALGFARRPYDRDHLPAGRSDDPALWAKRYWRRREAGDDVNLHVRVAGSPNERLALLFRDWMRAHPDAVAAYSAFKRSLAATTPDLDTYTVVKDHIVDLVIVAAEEWASARAWSTATLTPKIGAPATDGVVRSET
jgi:GrpB-like predicted nucleotidyltransferase (UPF0157 family)